ncbi:rRNA maturation RNase YbeY [bacterium DOLJORAL78_65_58]|nr:MAG: rRNA maturation RNase YbeY [bacterium DOLJORAL78_65_58]
MRRRCRKNAGRGRPGHETPPGRQMRQRDGARGGPSFGRCRALGGPSGSAGVGLTDVLSFSGLEEVGAGPPDLAAGQAGAGTDLWLDPLHADDPVGMGEISGVGEIILAPDFIARRCAAQGWPLEKEIPMLVVHGCLHLLGWDHEEEERGRAMRRLESERLAACGLEHPLVGAKEDD